MDNINNVKLQPYEKRVDSNLISCVRYPYERTLSALAECYKRGEIERFKSEKYIFKKNFNYWVNRWLELAENFGVTPAPSIHMDSQHWLLTETETDLFPFLIVFTFERMEEQMQDVFRVQPIIHKETVTNVNVKARIHEAIISQNLKDRFEELYKKDYELYDYVQKTWI